MNELSELTQIAGTLGPSAFPRKFAVELTAECNLACSMCHHPTMRRPKGVMPFELFRRCADQVAAIAPKTEVWISFCGEPLLEPVLLVEMLRYGRSVGLRSLNVNTNGVLLDARIAREILAAEPDLIVIGIDGYSRETYEANRCGGDRDLVYANVERLLELRDATRADTEVQVQFIEMDNNRHEAEQVRDHWLARGAVAKIRRQLSWGGQIHSSLCIPDHGRIACPWAVTMMHVFWDGRVPRCPGDTEGEEGVGNAWHEPLTTLWAQLDGYRELHLQHRFDELPERCSRCTDWATGAAVRVRPKHGQTEATTDVPQTTADRH